MAGREEEGRVLKVAVIGCGRMGEHHVRAAQRIPGVVVTCVVDPDPRAVERVKAALGVEGGFTSLDELLDRAGHIDAAHIVSPPRLHAETARRLLERGVHVYVEKPFTETFAEASALLRLATSRKLIAMPGHQLMFEKPTELAMRLLPGIGRVVHVESFFSFRPSRPTDGRPGLTQAAQLLDILPHPTYLLDHFLPEDDTAGLEITHLSADESGEIRALVRKGRATGIVVTTLTGRPVESYVKVVGSRGTLSVDYVRGIVVRSLEAGTLGKIVNPYAETWTRLWGTTSSLARRFLKKERYYPGLTEAFGRFYGAIREGAPAPVRDDNILRTVELCELAAARIEAAGREAELEATGRQAGFEAAAAPTIAVTGGTGFLGVPIVRSLVGRGEIPLVLSRRIPSVEERVEGAVYQRADLADPDSLEQLPATVRTVIHAAAETVGGWDAHERNSVQATRNLVQAASRRGIDRLIYVSSIAVVSKDAAEPITSQSPTEPDGRSRGPYVWGKLRGEDEARTLGAQLGVRVKAVRPSALVDNSDFSPPGKLGRALGPAFIAIGPKRAPLATIDVGVAGNVLAWASVNFERAPEVLNLTDPGAPTRRELADRLKATVPGLRILWFPWWLVHFLNIALWIPQKVLRPGKPAINLPAVFRSPRYRTDDVTAILAQLAESRRQRGVEATEVGRETAFAE